VHFLPLPPGRDYSRPGLAVGPELAKSGTLVRSVAGLGAAAAA